MSRLQGVMDSVEQPGSVRVPTWISSENDRIGPSCSAGLHGA